MTTSTPRGGASTTLTSRPRSRTAARATRHGTYSLTNSANPLLVRSFNAGDLQVKRRNTRPGDRNLLLARA
eukprot:11224168-Lingulodinium_polyedra.AAC.1